MRWLPFALLLAACAGDRPPPRATPPAAGSDDRFTVGGPRAWYLVPDGLTEGGNALDVEEMVAIFTANWAGAPLERPATLMLGFHPAASFSLGEQRRVDGILDHADRFLASRDRGPVVYVTLDRLPLAYPR